uniref:Uncharacterized protein n=1 Tax=Arundo donax TaxID=35708 RepID=A0A0A9EVJ0_ARUDO
MPELREAHSGGVQGLGQEPEDPAGSGGAGAGIAAVQAPDQQARRGREGGRTRSVPDAEEDRPLQRWRAHPQRGPRRRQRREGAAEAEPAEDAEPGCGAGAGVQGDERPDVQDGQGQVLRRRLLPPDRRPRLAEAVLMEYH